MENFFILVISALFVGGFAWLIVKGRQAQKQQQFDRKVQARKLGWSYLGTREGRVDYRFAGINNGIEWSMWHDSDRGDKSPTPKAYWQSSNVRTPHLSLVIIGRTRYQMESAAVSRVLMDVVSGIAQAVSGDVSASGRADKAEFYESATPLEEGGTIFRERYVVAIAPDMPQGWVDTELQALLLTWPRSKSGADYRCNERVEVNLSQDGLKIVAQYMPEDFVFWKHLAQLGQALAKRLATSAAHQ